MACVMHRDSRTLQIPGLGLSLIAQRIELRRMDMRLRKARKIRNTQRR